MNKLQCELCASVDIVKTEDNLFKCTACGCCYTLEQARYLVSGKVTAVQPDFMIRAGMLEKYNGEAINAQIPPSVTIIGTDAFSGCPGLKSVTIPSGVYAIGDNSFSGCSGLTSVLLPDTVKSMGYGAFRGCSQLTEFTLPKKTEIISSHLFENCTSLKKITLHNGLRVIESYAFNGCTALEEIILPDGVTQIDSRAFAGCKSLNRIYIPESVTAFGSAVFHDCKNVSEIICLSSEALPKMTEYFSPDTDINGYMENTLCRHCGGSFKGLFTRRCRICGKEKDYIIKKGKISLKNI